MPPNKSKKGVEESPEERRSKRKKLNEDEEEEEREREPVSKASSSKKTPAFTGGSSHKPAELFRKDLISAMKLADSEPLTPEEYLLIADAWRQEWERGVQVPVNEVSIPRVDLREVTEKSKGAGDFKIPKKFLHAMKDETYQLGLHELTGMSQLAEQVVRYDLDDLDVNWLQQLNQHREEVGEPMIHEWTMERVIEGLESQCHENMEIKKKTEEGLGIEYDEDIVCEICQSPDSEDSNEMVFCDGCDICVHQACYGIQTVPEGSWLCRTCALGIKPQCILCPKSGGAMKSTRSGTKWAHVSCAIWIPEVTIGCVEKMEPITKISQIPASRWALICVICKERCGACIQCSVKACKTAFHVTCAISEKLEMKTVLVEEKNSEDVKLKAYCPKHSKKRDRNNSESDPDSPRKSNCGSPLKEREMSEEEKASLRADRLHKLEDEFYNLVKVPEIATQLEVKEDVVDHIFVFWKLKRRSLFNRPLLTPKTEEADLLEKQQEDSLVARMKMFVHLRQDLERVRNLSYMISKREKIKRQFSRARESVFYAALEVLTDKGLNLSGREVDKIVRQFRELPAPYNRVVKRSKPEGEGSVGGSKKSSPSDMDWETSSVGSTQSNKSKTTDQQELPGKPGKISVKRESFTKKSIDETPKSRKQKGRNSAVESKTDVEVKSEVETDLSVCDGDVSAMDTSELIDVGTEEAVPNVSHASSASVLKALQNDSESQAVKSPSRSVTKGRSLKQSRNGSSITKPDVKLDSDQLSEKLSSDSESERNHPSSRRLRTRSSLPETEDVAGTVAEPAYSEWTEDKKVKCEKKDGKASVERLSSRERRPSATAPKLSEEEKEELIKNVPSAKNVSDHVKAELNGYFKSNRLVVSRKLRQKVQNSLLGSRRRSHFSNGIIIDHSQKKIDSFFMKSPPQCDVSHKSPAKAVSRVLNELSPSRDRFEANNIERTASLRSLRDSKTPPTRCSPHNTDRERSIEKGSVGKDVSHDLRHAKRRYDTSGVVSAREKLFDTGEKRRSTRASRESTPDSCAGSVRSYSSSKRDIERIRTRSNTPLSLGKDSDESESENFCSDSKRRRTKSQGIDSSVKDGSLSPHSVHRPRVKTVLS